MLRDVQQRTPVELNLLAVVHFVFACTKGITRDVVYMRVLVAMPKLSGQMTGPRRLLGVVEKVGQVSAVGVSERRRRQLRVVQLALDVTPQVVEQVALYLSSKLSAAPASGMSTHCVEIEIAMARKRSPCTHIENFVK